MDLIHILEFILFCIFSPVYTNTDFMRRKCPSRCHCAIDPLEEGRLIINCKWPRIASETRPFAHFPQNITKTLSIECETNAPSEFSDDSFIGFTSLQHLRIQKCRVRSLPKNLFRGLGNLRSLQLFSMGLSDLSMTVSEGAFDDLNRLEKLAIVDSHIQVLPAKSICNSPNLQVMNVSSNWLSSANLGLDLDCSAEQLIIVDLSHNRIHAVGSSDLVPLVAVRQLSLANNLIEHMDRESLQACTLLQQLHLENNRVQEVPLMPDTMIHLNVANNQLNIIPSTVAKLPNLISLNLSGNSIDASSPFPISSPLLEVLDLSKNRFETVPLLLFENSGSRMKQLVLSSNRISLLSANLFRNFSHLQTLDLGNNRISEISNSCFNGLTELQQLQLSRNSIYHVGFDIFNSLIQLLELDLSSNMLLEVPVAIGRLFKLKMLNLSGNQISKTYKFLFNKLPHLHSLDLSYNRIQSVESYVFSDLPRLVEISLAHNSIDRLAQDSFAKCPKLRQIDLSANFLPKLFGAISGLLSLRRLNLSSNLIEILQWSEIPVSTSHLEITDNHIALVGTAANSRIKVAQLQNNRIMVLSAEHIPSSIERLNVSNNSIHVVANGTFSTKPHLKVVDIRNNRLTRLNYSSFATSASDAAVEVYVAGNPLFCTCEMDWLRSMNSMERGTLEIVDQQQAFCIHRIDKRRISLAHVTRDELLCSYDDSCHPDCICCQFGNCDCKSKCPAGCECYRNGAYSTNIVRCSSLSENHRKNFSPKDLPMYATHVYLEKMNLPVIRSHDFLGRARLLQLYINSSSVREIQPLAFNTLPSLQLLDLSGNELRRLTGDEMFRTQKVTHLFLNNNRLHTFGSRVKEVMPALQFVTLHNNGLQDLPTVIEDLGKQLTKVSLASNPFRCDCGSRFRLQSWLPINIEKVADASDIVCTENITQAFRNNDTTVLSAYPPNQGNDVFIMPVTQFIEDANKSICVPTASGIFGVEGAANSILLIILIVVILLVVASLIFLVVGILSRTHSVMAQRRYKAPPSLNCSQTTPGSSPLPLIHFDAFVSYAKKDEKLIIDSLCRQLESEEYLLCLLHRDGPTYNTRLHSVSDELINQMECSQSLILVLTKNFLESEWKTLQIKTSHQLFAKNRNKKLIALLGEGIEPNQLDAELGQILRKNTCIRMNDPLFWNLLHSALPIRIAPSSCSGDSSQIYSDCYGSIVPSDIV